MTWWEILTVVLIALGVVGILAVMIKNKIKAKRSGKPCASCPYAKSCMSHSCVSTSRTESEPEIDTSTEIE